MFDRGYWQSLLGEESLRVDNGYKVKGMLEDCLRGDEKMAELKVLKSRRFVLHRKRLEKKIFELKQGLYRFQHGRSSDILVFPVLKPLIGAYEEHNCMVQTLMTAASFLDDTDYRDEAGKIKELVIARTISLRNNRNRLSELIERVVKMDYVRADTATRLLGNFLADVADNSDQFKIADLEKCQGIVGTALSDRIEAIHSVLTDSLTLNNIEKQELTKFQQQITISNG